MDSHIESEHPSRALPFYHPTTVLLVDDNENFLNDLSLLLDDRTAFKLFTSPIDAINYIKQQQNSEKLAHPYETLFPYTETSLLNESLKEPYRFMTNSVLIADYSMPEMNGIELFKAIQRPNIKKILLTATMDQQEAIDAFNDGVIDKFISKQESDWLNKLNDYIHQCQRRYFAAECKQFDKQLNTQQYDFLKQPSFNQLFNDICLEHDVVEYYLATTPAGYLLVSNNKQLRLIVIKKDEREFLPTEQYRFITQFKPLAESDYLFALVDETEPDTTHTISNYHDFIRELDEALLTQY